MASSSDKYNKSSRSNETSKRNPDGDCENSDCIEENRPIDENFDLMEFINKNKKSLKNNYGYQQISKKRPPRFYFINDKKSILIVIQGDITRTKVDAIVNAANEHMTGGGGVDGIIHRAAGQELYRACRSHKQISDGVRLPTGHSRILLSYEMISTTYHIINTAGPVYYSSDAEQCAKDLTECYRTSLALANLYDLESIGYTAISCGIFGYPARGGANVALKTVNEKADRVPVVVFVLWDDHIYDAWVDEAQKLKFEQFDLDTVTQENSRNVSKDDNKTVDAKRTKANSDADKSKTAFNPTIKDYSTVDTSEPITDKDKEESTESKTDKEKEESTESKTDKEKEESTESKTDKDKEELTKSKTDKEKEESTESKTDKEKGESTESTTDVDFEDLTKRLPSVPDDTSDTQRTEEMEVDESRSDPDPKLHSQKTVEMTNVERKESDLEKPVDDEQYSVEATPDNKN